MRTLRSGVSRGTETLVFRGGVPAEPVRRDARAVPGGRLPRAGEVRLPQRRRRRATGPRELRGRTVFCLYPHQTAYVVPAAAVRACRTTCRRRARCWPARWRPRSTRSGTPRRWSATGSPSSARAWSAAAWPGCSPGSPACDVTLVDVDAGAGRGRRRRSASASRCPATPPAAGTSSCTPAPRRPGCSARWTCSAPEGTVIDLSWYGDAETTLSLGGAFHSGRLAIRGQPGRARSPRPGADAARTRRPAGAGAGPAARPGVRRAAHRRVAGSPSCRDVMPRLADGSLPALCHTDHATTTTAGGDPCSA